MFTKYLLPLIAVAGILFAVHVVLESRKTPSPAQPLISPPQAPDFDHITGIGSVESQQRNVPIGTQVAGVVSEVYVLNKEGMHVELGEPLFKIDDRQLRAELKVREAQLISAQANLARLRAAPRAEDVPPAEANVEEMRARVLGTEVQAKRSTSLYERGVGPPSDYDHDRYAAQEAKAGLRKAETELYRLKRGTWDRDIAVAEAAVLQAQADVDRTETELDRLVVRAMSRGEILQVNVLPGQFAALAWKEPLIVLANNEDLNIRVEIDESYVPYLQKGSKAFAILRSRPGLKFSLQFVRVDPYIVPKKNLMGDNTEKVDTRVLQAVFNVEKPLPMPLYVGQVMDVFIQAVKPAGVDLTPRTIDPAEVKSTFDSQRATALPPPRLPPVKSPGLDATDSAQGGESESTGPDPSSG
jgi:multidrug resistance efflux pump